MEIQQKKALCNGSSEKINGLLDHEKKHKHSKILLKLLLQLGNAEMSQEVAGTLRVLVHLAIEG
jgi:hypothetical protein